MTFIEYPDRELMMLAVADKMAGELGDFLRRTGKATFCVPGGTTPAPVFDVLSDVDLDWAGVTVLLNDERWVPETSPRSNGRLVREHLLKGKAAAARFVPFYHPTPTPEESLVDIDAALEGLLPISVLMLGVGADMHTASLFPGADRLAQAMASDAPPVMVLRSEAAGDPRVTLTLPVLKAAVRTHVVATGPEKRAAIERAQKLGPMEAPIRALLDDATVHWAE